MRYISFLLLFVSSSALCDTEQLFNSLFEGLKERRLLLRHEIRNIQEHYEGSNDIYEKEYAINRLRAISNLVNSISTSENNKFYIKTNISNLIDNIEVDLYDSDLPQNKDNIAKQEDTNNNLVTSMPIAINTPQEEDTQNEVQKVNIKQSAVETLPKTTDNKDTDQLLHNNLFQYFISFIALSLMFILGRKSQSFRSNTSIAQEDSPNESQAKTLRKLLTFFTNTIDTPALICNSKQQVKWSNPYCIRHLDIKARDIFSYKAETIAFGKHRYIESSGIYYLVQSKKIKNYTLYFFIALELKPTVAASKVSNYIDVNVTSFQKVMNYFKGQFYMAEASFEFQINGDHESTLNYSKPQLKIIQSYLEAILTTIKNDSQKHAFIKLNLEQTSSDLELTFDMKNISSNSLRFQFSQVQRALKEYKLFCTFFNGTHSISAKVMHSQLQHNNYNQAT